MPVPNQFANVTTSIPLSQLDANFNTPITLGNTSIQLGNVVTTLNNMTFANATISSGNVTITNVTVTTANVTNATIATANITTANITTGIIATANVTTGNITNLATSNAAITGGSIEGTSLGASNASTANVTTLTTSSTVTLNGGTANGVAYLNSSKVVTTGTVLVFDGTNLGIGVSSPANKLDVVGTIQAAAAATQDAVALAGRSGGTSSYVVTLTPTTLTGNQTLTLPDASTTITGTDATQTLTNKRFNPRTSTAASTASLTPDISSFDQYNLTAQAATLAINAPIGTPVDGNKLIFRILDNGTSRTINWNGTYTAIGVTLPTATTINKMLYVGCIYNSTNTRWDVVAVNTQA